MVPSSRSVMGGAMRGLFSNKGMPGGRVRLSHPVYFARHGQTDWNAEKRFQGHADSPLNDIGRAQAFRNGKALAEELPPARRGSKRLTFIASPLVRARETMEIMRRAMDLPAQRYMIDDRLTEIHLGDWNGKTPDEINTGDPGIFERRERDKWAFVVPGGESYAEAAGRTRDFLNDLEGPALIVGHGASGRILRGFLRGLKRDEVPHLVARQDIVLKLERGREVEI